MLCKTHRRTLDNTIAKTNRDKQCYTKHIEKRQQYHGLNQQGQTMYYKTHRRTSDNTMAKTHKGKQCYTKHIEERTIENQQGQTMPNIIATNKDKQCYMKHIEERQTIP